MRNKNFHLWRIRTINIRTGKDDQKIERVIHEIAKAKLSLWWVQELCCLDNNSVIITTNRTILSKNMNSTGPAMQLKGNTGLVSPLKQIKVLRQRKSHLLVPELLLLMYCYMGAPYELFVAMHLLKRTLIHQKISTVN